MKPKDVVWPLEPHTRGKHEVLRRYLTAWFPIIGSFAQRMVFIDGFAGPGEYSGGEPGSPLIALESYGRYADRIKGEVFFLFVEEDQARMEHLKKVVKALPDLPKNVKLQAATADFERAMTSILNRIKPGRQLAPAFVMVDPFGVKGFPMALIQRILKSGKAELYISFMYEFIDRFKSTPEFDPILTALYGTDGWKKGLELTGQAKKRFFFDLYDRQLRTAGAKHVLRFDLYRNSHHVYALFFATQHPKGADVMKRAMWSAAPFGDFAFRGGQTGQMILGIEPDYTPLRKALQAEFSGHGWVTIEQVEEFVASDKTPFHSGQLKTPVLVPLETEGLVEVDSSTRKRTLRYPPGTKLRFV